MKGEREMIGDDRRVRGGIEKRRERGRNKWGGCKERGREWMKREEGGKWIERKKMDREREGWIERKKKIDEERMRRRKKGQGREGSERI